MVDAVIACRSPARLRVWLNRHAPGSTARISRALLDAFHRSMRADRARATKVAAAARRLSDVSGDGMDRARADRMAGLLDHLEGRPGVAARRLTASVRRLESQESWLEAGDVHRILIDVRMLADDDRRVAASARAALECYRRAGGADPRRLGSVAMNLGNLHHRRDRYRQALSAYKRAREHFEAAGESRRIGNVDFNVANILASIDRVDEARELYEGARQRFSDAGETALVARATAALAVVDMTRGRFDSSLERLRELGPIYERLTDPQGSAHADIDAAEALLCLNRPAEATAAARRADRFLRRAGHEADSATCSGLIGSAALQSGHPARAIRGFRRAADVQRRLGNPVAAAVHDVGHARARLARSEPDKALALARRAATSLGRRKLRSKQARALAVAAEAACRVGRRADARRLGRRARELARRCHDLRAELSALMALARVERDAGNSGRAYRWLKSAARCVELLRIGVTSEESRLAFALDKSCVYEELVLNRLAANTPASIRKALEYAERGKARALAERLAQGRLDWVGAGRERSRKLMRRLERIEERLATAERRLEDPAPRPGWRGASTLRGLTVERESLLETMAARDPAGAALVGAAPPDPGAFIEGLDERDLVLEFVEAGGWLHLFAIQRGSVRAFRGLAPVDALRKEADALRFQLGKGVLWDTHSNRFRGFIADELDRLCRSLHDTLLGPVDELLDGRRIHIVPHGALHGLPMHAFKADDTPLVERAIVSYAPSLAVLGLLSAGAPRGSGSAPVVLGVADAAAPLIDREVHVVGGFLPDARVFRGGDASGRVLESTDRPRLLHVACHGFFAEDRPWQGALRLGDTWLSLADLYELEGMADVVVLSGCQTGRGVVYSGDEWVGLARGFLQAGARAVVASQWEVRDHGTLMLMERFYDELTAGRPLAEAMAFAQRRARLRDDLPLLWAPFVVIGDSSLKIEMRRAA